MQTEEFSIDKLQERFKLSNEAIRGCGFSADELRQIFDDYRDNRMKELEECKNEFLSRYIMKADGIKFHSYGGRVKDPYHLIEKIIRKKHNNFAKYGLMRVDDYFKYITDLIGCRILLVYKDDWVQIHNYLVNTFENSDEKYIDDKNYSASYIESVPSPYMVERPVVYIRAGDYDDVYSSVHNIKIDRGGYYRSAHYIIRLEKYYMELQVRSLFDEAWGEVDHDVLYPYHKDDKSYVRFSEIISRISGTGDELSAYFKKFVSHDEKSGSSLSCNSLNDTPILPPTYDGGKRFKDLKDTVLSSDSLEDMRTESTPSNELNRILGE